MKQHLLLVDGSALFAKCYHGNLPFLYKKAASDEKANFEQLILHAKDGTYTNGIFGFMKALEKIILQQKPTHMAITFDVSRNTFRKELYPLYKGNRKESEPPFSQQKELLPKLLTELGYFVVMSEKETPACTYEGDDLIGSLAAQFKGQIPITILSNDHDMTQLVEPGVNLWLDTRSESRASEMFLEYTGGKNGLTLSNLNLPKGYFPFGIDSVEWDMGVPPRLVPALKALAGDASDNIPGLRGISLKSAALLLQKYGSVKAIFEEIDQVKGNDKKEKALRKKWKDEIGMVRVTPFLSPQAKHDVLLSHKLATIVTSLRFPVGLDDLTIKINKDARQQWYEKLSFYSLLQSKAS